MRPKEGVENSYAFILGFERNRWPFTLPAGAIERL
jgi:hypothetical protein